jgi:sulfite reductase (NADPH) flavoprotein alpha-component
MAIPLIPESAPFDAAQRAWLNGYLAGLFSVGDASTAPKALESKPTKGPLLFLYGSQTGSSEGLAYKFSKSLKNRGFDSQVLSMEAYASRDLAAEKNLILITSTYGDGEMPDNAQALWSFLSSDQAPQLSQTSFAVLALGDRNYPQFCEAGVLFDRRLAELGSKRLIDRVDCDVDYEAPSEQWMEALVKVLDTDSGDSTPAITEQRDSASEVTSYGKNHPFPAKLKTNRLLNAQGSEKETRHFEIDLEGSGLSYEAGDALGVIPRNCPDFVQEILTASGLSPEQPVDLPSGESLALCDALLERFDLSPFLGTMPALGTAPSDLITPLRKLQPRLYSISSSPKAHPGEVHLTVGIVRYALDGKLRKGVCSTFLADRVNEGSLPVFVHKSPNFRLPKDSSLPVIMVGPGTGIAPFRAFLEERRATGSPGKNWLFFGDQRSSTDFLYQEEIEGMQADGLLTHLDLAFSRDQPEKIYVQNHMMEKAEELWSWLQEGASFYVCGDAKRMAKDVDATLHQIIEKAGGRSPEEAVQYVQELKSQKRYLRDVY